LTEVDRVNRISEMLLDLARPLQLRLVPLNLHQLLERVATLHEEACRELKIGLVRSYDPSLPPILGDEDRLVQVFHNLLRNAFDAMPSGGRLTLTTRVSLNPLFGKMDLGAGQRNMVEAKVADEGGTAVKDGPGALQAFEAEPFDLVFLDVRMPGVDGLAVLARLRELRPDATVVVMTAHGTMDTAIQAMQRGAYDYLAKPFDLDEFVLLAERALAARRLTQEVRQLKRGLQEVWEFGAIIGRHPRMQEV